MSLFQRTCLRGGGGPLSIGWEAATKEATAYLREMGRERRRVHHHELTAYSVASVLVF